MKAHIDRSVAGLDACRASLIPGELGWFGLWPPSASNPGLQLDEIEYLLAKSLAFDAPSSPSSARPRIGRNRLDDGEASGVAHPALARRGLGDGAGRGAQDGGPPRILPARRGSGRTGPTDRRLAGLEPRGTQP